MPRPVGVASRDELLILELTTDADPADVQERLSRQMPSGMRILSAERLEAGDRKLPTRVEYTLQLEPLARESVARSATELLSRENMVVQRKGPKDKQPRSVDIRPFMISVSVEDDTLRWTQAVTTEGTARITEVLEGLDLPVQDCLHKVVRNAATYAG